MIRNQALYPVELQAHFRHIIIIDFPKTIHDINRYHNLKRMYLFSKFNLLKISFLSTTLALLPFSFIAGNMLININIIIIVIFTIIFANKKLLDINFYLFDKILIFFFFLIISTSIANDILVLNKLSWSPNFSTTVKAFLFLRYLFLYFSIRFLVENKLVNLKLFFISCSVASIFVCLDIFYQFFNGVDIFGYKTIPELRKLGGPFGDELIAGGFIQRFSIFSFFIMPLFFLKKTEKYLPYIMPLLFTIFFIGIILSGNRMPLILFLLNIFLIIIFQKQTRKFLIPFIIIFPIIFITVFNFNEKVKLNFLSLYGQISGIVSSISKGNFNTNNSPQYLKEFSSFYETWRLNKYTGGGIKSFRYYCHVRKNIDVNSKFICNMHPHNYYLEILTETGLLGFIIISVIFLMVLYLSLYKKYFIKSRLNQSKIIIPFVFLFITEIFPLKSTGSFFTTGNSTYIFLILAILIGLIRKENSIENKI